jgi:hypothetical protein
MGSASMGICRRLTAVMAVITLGLQVIVAAVGTVSLCMDRPHTHGGVPAPDCPMHHQQPAAATTEDHHQHGAQRDATSDASRVGCRCSSDPLSFLISDIGVVPDRISVRLPVPGVLSLMPFKTTTLDVRIAPLSPPPRLSQA